MAVPKKRRSYTRKHIRRSHHALKNVNLSFCAQCGNPILPHRICGNCQAYGDKQILAVED